MNRRSLLFFLILIISHKAFSQNLPVASFPEVELGSGNNINYVVSLTPSVYTNNKTFDPDSLDNWNINLEFYDGLGFKIQQLSYGFYQGSDVVKLYEYDARGKLIREYLPYVSSDGGLSYKTSAESAQASFYQTLYSSDGINAYYSKTYEASPRALLKTERDAGAMYSDGLHDVEYDYKLNENEILRLECDSAGNLYKTGFYPKGSLRLKRTKDQDGYIKEEYSDSRGHVIVSRSQINATDYVTLYSVYDSLNDLRYVLQPMCYDYISSSPQSSFSPQDSILKFYAFYYTYDLYGRLRSKRLPGSDTQYFVYDRRGNVVFSSDANSLSQHKWYYSKYDKFSRVVEQGAVKGDYDADWLAGYVENCDEQWSEYEASSGLYSEVFPDVMSGKEVYSLYYYDNYDILSVLSVLELNYDPVEGTDGYYGEPEGKLVLRKDYVYNADSVRETFYEVNYYDKKGRTIETIIFYKNRYRLVIRNFYDANDYMLVQTERFQGDSLDVSIKHHYYYDKWGRQIKEQVYAGDSLVLSTDKRYDYLSRETDAFYNDSLLHLSRTYRIEGWLSRMSATGRDSLLFDQNFSYEGSYRGNITGISWRDVVSQGSSYRYSYDGLSRLLKAEYEDNEGRDFGSGYGYDHNGNILQLSRHSVVSGKNVVIDSLRYIYDGNRIRRIKDLSQPSVEGSLGFATTVADSIDAYSYDGNGNLISDLNKDLYEIKYNEQNLPVRLIFYDPVKGSDTLSYVYNRGGGLLAYVHGKAERTYLGGFELEGGNLIYRGGNWYLDLSGDEKNLYLYIRDHLGNIRAVVSGEGRVLETNNYYPYGMQIKPLSQTYYTSSDVKNRYLYNSKELQDELGLNWYDYGARNYDPALGRFMNIDPLAEQYDFQSPFVYANNNPVLYRDILGMGVGEDEDRKNDDYFPENNFDDETEIPNFDDNPNNNTFSTYYVNNTTGETIYVDDGSDEIVMVDDEDWHYVKAVEGTHIYLGFMDFYRKGRTMLKLPKYYSDNHYSNFYYIPTSKLIKSAEKIYNQLTIGNEFSNIYSFISSASIFIKINPLILSQVALLQLQNNQMEEYGSRYKNIFSKILQEHYNARTYNSGILVIETGSVGVSTTGSGGVVNNVMIYDTYTKKVVASWTEHYP